MKDDGLQPRSDGLQSNRDGLQFVFSQSALRTKALLPTLGVWTLHQASKRWESRNGAIAPNKSMASKEAQKAGG